MGKFLGKMVFCSAALLLLTVGKQASAEFIFHPSVLYFNYNEQLPSSATDQVTLTYYDFKVGFTEGNLYLGGLYSLADRNYGGSIIRRTNYGGSIGYFTRSLYLLGHVLFGASYNRQGSYTLNNGFGFQVDLGYLFPLGTNVSAGPQLSYTNITYKNESAGGTDTGVSLVHSQVVPMVNIAFIF